MKNPDPTRPAWFNFLTMIEAPKKRKKKLAKSSDKDVKRINVIADILAAAVREGVITEAGAKKVAWDEGQKIRSKRNEHPKRKTRARNK